jgi:hypothetical protein
MLKIRQKELTCYKKVESVKILQLYYQEIPLPKDEQTHNLMFMYTSQLIITMFV